ncbi:MAG: cupin domain-containing protein [Dehalococcoidia bacterium]
MISSMPTITDTVDGPIPPRVDSDTWPGVLHTRPADLAKRMGTPPWFTPVIVDERNQVTLIAGGPGHGNRPHWHEDFDEWWFILAGELQWELTGGRTLAARKGDIVWVPRGTTHHIKNVGDEISLRVAVGMPPGIHYYHDCDVCGHSDDGPREWDVPLDAW